mgnify:CR=1 FL=1
MIKRDLTDTFNTLTIKTIDHEKFKTVIGKLINLYFPGLV